MRTFVFLFLASLTVACMALTPQRAWAGEEMIAIETTPFCGTQADLELSIQRDRVDPSSSSCFPLFKGRCVWVVKSDLWSEEGLAYMMGTTTGAMDGKWEIIDESDPPMWISLFSFKPHSSFKGCTP